MLGRFSNTEICIFYNFLTLFQLVILCVLYKSDFVVLTISMTIAHKFEVEICKAPGDFRFLYQKMRALLL